MKHCYENNSQNIQSISLRNFLYVLFKHKNLIITFFLAVVSIVIISSIILQPTYQAEAKIQVEREIDPEKTQQAGSAVKPTKPVKPKQQLNVLLAISIGLFGGLGLAFLREYFDHTINTPEELERLTGLQVFGSVREINLDNSNDPATIQARQLLGLG